VFALIDSIDPLPRRTRIGFYHFLSALMCAAAFMWVAYKIRDRFGFAAATGFVVPVAFEPMFTALAPNLYWAVGLWFVPMAIAMDIAGAENRRRKWWLIVAIGAAVFAKSLCGYEFITTVIVAAMIGCLLNTRDEGGYPFQNIIDMVWVALAGVAGFVLAVLVHGAKLGFAVILDRAIDRTSGGGSAVDQGLNIGQFASVSSVLRTYLGANDYTQIRNFGLLIGVLGVVAVAAFLDQEYGWFLGADRRKLRTLAFAFLASLAAPLSWFILAKAHAYAHQPLDFILWHVPTVPVGGAMAALAVSQAFDRDFGNSSARPSHRCAGSCARSPHRWQGNMGAASACSRHTDFCRHRYRHRSTHDRELVHRRIPLRPDRSLGCIQVARDQPRQGDELRFSAGGEQGHRHSKLEMLLRAGEKPEPVHTA
jgi:hypothetical protein